MTKKEINRMIKEMERISSIDIEKEIKYNKKANNIILGISVILLSITFFALVMLIFGVSFKEIQNGFLQ